MNSELLYITRKLGYPSSFGTRAGLGDFLEQYPDGVYAENGGGAPIGWESAAVWFGGDSERAAARFERMMSERNELSRLFRTRVSGVLVLTFIYRLKSRMVTAIPIIGGQPQPIDPTWLYFTMPRGGTVSLTKNGTPTAVTLEYSLDNGNTWTEWIETENVRSLTLAAGQTMHVRNTSETTKRFSTGISDYYHFSFTADTYAGGAANSLLCRNPSIVQSVTQYVFLYLFRDCTTLISASELKLDNIASYRAVRHMFYCCSSLIEPPRNLGETAPDSCYGMFENCVSLIKSPILNNEDIDGFYTYNSMFRNCSNLKEIRTYMKNVSGSNALGNWVDGVADTGDFYCPAELTIPEGASGIPSGWTRHDI